MKNSVKTVLTSALLVVSLASFAGNRDEKTILKSRQMVEKATPDDWKALAEAASFCIDKKANLTEASAWLEKSLSIKETAYNLGVKGDYLVASNQSDKAIDAYVKALQTGLKENVNFDTKELQTKIAAANKNR